MDAGGARGSRGSPEPELRDAGFSLQQEEKE